MADLVAFLRRNQILPRESDEAAAAAERESVAGDPDDNTRARRSTRKRRRHATLNVPTLPSAYGSADATDEPPTGEDTLNAMRVASFDDLIREFPHLRRDLGAERPPADGAAAAEAAPSHVPATSAPWLNEEFARMIHELPNVRLLGYESGGPAALEWLKSRLTVLPLLTASYESELLQEAGTFPLPDGRMVTYPRCRKGEQCAACVYPIPNAPQPRAPALTQLVFPHEMEALRTTGAPPMEHRLCILCCRLATYQLVLALRWYADTARLSHDVLLQVYRNPIDQADGYRREVCVLPSSTVWEGFLDPVVMFKPALLTWVQHPETHRWALQQDLLLFRPLVVPTAADLEPQPFETPLAFRLRSERLLWGSVRHQPLHPVRELLRRGGAAPRSLRKAVRVDAHILPPRAVLQKELRRGGYEAQLLLDALLRGQNECLAVERVVCEDTLLTPVVHTALLRSSLWRATGNANTGAGEHGSSAARDWTVALAHLFSKGAPQRCQTRKFAAVCVGLVEQHADLDAALRRWTLCTLLGNYRHVQHRQDYLPPSPRVRARLYSFLEERGKQEWPAVRESLRAVLVFVVREVMVAEIGSCPAMQRDLETRLNWPAFASAVCATLSAVRQVVHHALEHTGAFPPASAYASIAERGHHDVLAVAQRRPTRPLVALITGQALRAFMDRLPPLSPALQRVMHEWTRALPPGPAELGAQFVPWLGAFGVPDEARLAFWKLCVNSFHHAPSRRDLTIQLEELCTEHPWAMSLAHAWCKAYLSAQRCVRRALPQHYLLHQANAVRTRLGLPAGTPLPDYAVSVMVCRGCGRLFDGTWTWKLPTRTKPLRAERFTMRGARVDLLTDQITCDHCVYAKNPVVQVDRINLLGCVLVCPRGLVLLCPQPGCGIPMAYDSRCRYTSRGVACASCTLALTERPPSSQLWDKMCALCRRCAREPRLFPFRITVCGFHVREEVTERWTSAAPTTREEGVEILRVYAAELKEVLWSANSKRRRLDLNASRRRSRMTGRQRYYERFRS